MIEAFTLTKVNLFGDNVSNCFVSKSRNETNIIHLTHSNVLDTARNLKLISERDFKAQSFFEVDTNAQADEK